MISEIIEDLHKRLNSNPTYKKNYISKSEFGKSVRFYFKFGDNTEIIEVLKKDIVAGNYGKLSLYL